MTKNKFAVAAFGTQRNEKSNMYRRQIIWISLGGAAVLLRLLLSAEALEMLYSRGLFLAVRWVIDTFLGWLPIPILYLFLLTLLVLVGRRIQSWYRSTEGWRTKGIQAGLSSVAFVSGAIFFFLLLWGYNYGRIPVETQMGLEPKPLKLEELTEELRLETQAIINLRRQIPGITDSAFTRELLPTNLESELRSDLMARLQYHNFPTPGRVRALLLFPKGIFLRFSSAGLYFPWTGQGHVDAGLHPLQIPSVMAHEMAHGYGFGDEGTCSFWAYLACVHSEHPAIAYAAHLDYWRDLAGSFRRYEPAAYRKFRSELPIGIQKDLDAINETLLQYPDIMPRLRYVAYDAYLRTQGIKEGMLNYNRVTMLVHAWRSSKQI